MNNSEVPLFLQHKLDQWETSIDAFIRNQSEDELMKYIERLKHDIDNTSIDMALVSMLALFGLTYVWMKMMKKDDDEFSDEKCNEK